MSIYSGWHYKSVYVHILSFNKKYALPELFISSLCDLLWVCILCLCMHRHMYLCVWSAETDVQCFLLLLSTLLFETKSLSRLGTWPSADWSQMCTAMGGICTRTLGSVLRHSCFHSKHCTD